MKRAKQLPLAGEPRAPLPVADGAAKSVPATSSIERSTMEQLLRGFAAIALVALALDAAPALAVSGNVAAGRTKAVQCQACHGLDGLSKLPDAPHIAGQPEPYLVKSLNEYRKGIRKHELMSLVVQPLTDQDVADLAAYYSAIEITAKPPR